MYWATMSETRQNAIIEKRKQLADPAVKMFGFDCLERILPDLKYCIDNMFNDDLPVTYDMDDFLIISRDYVRGSRTVKDFEEVTAICEKIRTVLWASENEKLKNYRELFSLFDHCGKYKGGNYVYDDTILYRIMNPIRAFLVDKFYDDMQEKAEGVTNAIDPMLISAFTGRIAASVHADIEDELTIGINKMTVKILKKALTKNEAKKINKVELDWQESQLDLYVSGILTV